MEVPNQSPSKIILVHRPSFFPSNPPANILTISQAGSSIQYLPDLVESLETTDHKRNAKHPNSQQWNTVSDRYTGWRSPRLAPPPCFKPLYTTSAAARGPSSSTEYRESKRPSSTRAPTSWYHGYSAVLSSMFALSPEISLLRPEARICKWSA